MNIADKVAVTRLFQRLGLEGLPARIYLPDERPSRDQLAKDFGEGNFLMVRTATADEARNLPRLAGSTLADAASWIGKLPIDLAVIIQPYDEVVFSAELAVHGDAYVVELVPGIWELATNLTPTVVHCKADVIQTIAWEAGSQPASFHNINRGYYVRPARISDWQVAVVTTWVRNHYDPIVRAGRRFSDPFGLKLHYAACFGLSPQNIHTNVPVVDDPVDEAPPSRLGRVSTLADDIPHGTAVLLDISIAREAHSQLDGLISRMLLAQVRVVYLKSGLLSHLAINLREAGFTVRRFDGRFLCS